MKQFLTIGFCAVFTFEAYRMWNTDPQQAYACVVLVVFMVIIGVTLRTDR